MDPQHSASEVWTEVWTGFGAHTLYCETEGINLPQMKSADWSKMYLFIEKYILLIAETIEVFASGA
jgi:hypothetical protein